MNKFNWVAQDHDGCIYLYDKKPEHSDMGNWWRASVPNSDLSKISKGARHRSNWKESLIDLSKNDYIIKDGTLMATRKHAALIHAWADGAVIQYQDPLIGWCDYTGDEVPRFTDKWNLRIKPKTRTVTFKNYHIDGVIGVWVQGYQGLPGNAKLIDKDWQEVEIEL